MNHVPTNQPVFPDLFPVKLHNRALHPLLEPTLFYDPPYAHPTEDTLAWHLVKYLHPDASLMYNVRIQTPSITFELDFVIEYGDIRVGIMCGLDKGAEQSHQESLHYALMLEGGFVDTVFRFREEDLEARLHDALYVMARWSPEVFSERGRINLATLARPEAQTFVPQYGHAMARILYALPELEDNFEVHADEWSSPWAPEELVVRRLTRSEPAAWIREYNQALAYYRIPADWLGQRLARTA